MLTRTCQVAVASLPLMGLILCLVPVEAAEKPTPRPSEKIFSPAQIAFYEKEVLPLLKARCLKCHGEEKTRGGLRLTSREAVLKGGDLGPAVSLDKPESSRLLQAIRYKDGLEMPPSGKLEVREIELLTRWVRDGLPWTPGKGEVIGKEPEAGKVTPESRNYWAYRPLQRPAVPPVKNKAWVRTPVDAFILARLEARGLSPAPPADRIALVRRVYYDLLGLPPTPEEVDAFIKDTAPDAYEKLLDRLLASPHYGEKWGRHWLDLVRYAETHGYERDSAKPFAWRFRDYVIDSFNKDKPYDVFLQEQLAGDELDQVTSETLIATGYYRLGIWDDEPADRLQARYDVLDGIVSTTSQVMLGMTLNCARCHDHKKDPVPQRDYYRLLAFFQDITEMNVKNTRKISNDAERTAFTQQQRERQKREGQLYQEIYQLEQKLALGLQKSGKARVLPTSDITDLTYRFYRDTWEQLPEFDNLKPESEGVIASGLLSLAPASREQAIGLVFEGKLKVPQAGEYTFALDSTEGVRLLVAGKKVFERPAKGRQTGEARVALAAGLLPLRLEYFNTDRKPALQVEWSGPGMARRALSSERGLGDRVLLPDSRQEGRLWQYTFKQPAENWMQPEFKSSDWKQGPGGFGTRGTPGSVVRTTWRTSDIWLRQSFRLDRLPSAVALDLHHDEDAEIYLNGTLVHRVSRFAVQYARVSLGAEACKALRKGDNVLAVHCKQTGGGQYIDVGLVEDTPRVDLASLMRLHGPEILGKEAVTRYHELTGQLEEIRKVKPPEAGLEVMCVEERGQAPTHVLIRGNPGSPGERVAPGFPEVLGTGEPAKIPERKLPGSSGKRRALAAWITSESNPLTARVMVNRLWQYHFGRGIVPSSNDFGKLGEAPTHPELLDWMAAEFMKGGWRIKRMHKLLMLSNAYQMSAQGNEAGLKADPSNNLFWRFNMRRLTAEEVRDTILQLSGTLNLKAGGPSIYPPIPREVLAGQSVPGKGWHTSPPDEAARRSVYVHVKRSLLVPILEHHDQADTDSSCPVRYTTTVPTQALGMINGEFTNQQAGFLAARLQKEAPKDLAAQVQRALRLATGRVPTQEEVKKDLAFMKQMESKHKLTEQEALKKYCLLVLNLNELIYLD